MKGQQVVVRAFGGEALIRRVWSADDVAVYITDDKQLGLLLAGKEAIQPIGIHRRDVFKFRSEKVGELVSGTVAWSEMELWDGTD